MNYLGIDYGFAKIGIALAVGPLAEPLATVKTEKAIRSIKLLINTHTIDSIVVGSCPEKFLGELSELATVHHVDETLSSHDARQSLLHTSQKRRRLSEHAVSASIILQNWLDSQNQNL